MIARADYGCGDRIVKIGDDASEDAFSEAATCVPRRPAQAEGLPHSNASSSPSVARTAADDPVRFFQPLLTDRWLQLILLLALALRTYHIAYPAWDYHNWRQTQTLMVPRYLARHGFPVLSPQVQWIGRGGPNAASYFPGEFSVQGTVTALLYRLIGESDVLARVVVILFSLLGIYALYGLFLRRAGPREARLGAFVYALLPYHVFFGRVFMPDVPALSLALAGLLFLDRWTQDHKPRTLLAAAAFTALAILQKLTVAFVGLPMAYLFWLRYGSRWFRRPELYLFLAVVGVPCIAWYTHSNAMAGESGFAFVQFRLLGSQLAQWFQPAFLHRVLGAMSGEAFSPPGLGLALLGFFWPTREPVYCIFRLWVIGAALILFLIPDLVLPNLYYLSLLLPGAGALAGLALTRLVPQRYAHFVLPFVLTGFAAGALYSVWPLYAEDRAPYDAGVVLKNLTSPKDLIVTETGGSPDVLYFADRRGWMLDASFDITLIDTLAQSGARYYADASGADVGEKRDFFRAMDARFERLTTDGAFWPIYDLSSRQMPTHDLPASGMGRKTQIVFGSEVTLAAYSVRRLTEAPASFEVIYYWKRLGAFKTELRVFMHIVNSAGQIVENCDHWIANKRDASSHWNNGDYIRERIVFALPASVPKGRYQIRAGWFDPVSGSVLPIVSSTVPAGGDEAQIAAFDIGKTESYGWFRAR